MKPSPVCYRCEIHSEVAFVATASLARLRIFALSELGAFMEARNEQCEVQTGDEAVLRMALPGGSTWTSEITIEGRGSNRVNLRAAPRQHLSLSVSGFHIRFRNVADEELERLRDFLDALDLR